MVPPPYLVRRYLAVGSPVNPPNSEQLHDVERFSIAVHIAGILEIWNGSPTDERPRDGFPLEILYLAWHNQPKLVSPSTRSTGRIIPSKLAHVAPGDRQAGKLFAYAAHVALVAPEAGAAPGQQMVFSGLPQPEVNRQQFVLPGFKDSDTIGPCLPLALYDLGDAPATSRGPAAPLPLRLFVEAVLAVPMDSRDTYPRCNASNAAPNVGMALSKPTQTAPQRILAPPDGRLRGAGLAHREDSLVRSRNRAGRVAPDNQHIRHSQGTGQIG